MPITTVGVGAAVTPTVVKTCIAHYANRKPRRHKPTAHISYDEGLHLIRRFLDYASHHTLEDLQSFTGQWVPSPSWVRTENVTIAQEHITKSARTITNQLGPTGIEQIGGTKWWQWRPGDTELKADWIEMRSHHNEQKRGGVKSRRIMLYIHGGAYFFGSVDEHRYQMQRHARKLQARVFAPKYRLAPQYPFPCGLQDCLAAYLYLLTLHAPSEIILAGDSAGGGMVVSILCLLRDQELPLPAGAVLISPWVDLTHSFPSCAGNADLDYIPEHGFMHKPSASWPPPSDDEVSKINSLAKGVDGSVVEDQNQDSAPKNAVPIEGDGEVSPGPQLPLTIELDGKTVLLKDQIQMYTTNQLLAHPLVSPVLQPSLGGLPPVSILTGGGEILRDEQIYLAHKMANPAKYPLGKPYRSRYDPDDQILKKHRPTPVQLQVWDDLCHVAPTLSFTRPAKYMYRSIAQFGAWALARAQRRAIEILDDDDISIISTESDSASTDSDSEAVAAKQGLDPSRTIGFVGRAGDPLPPFQNNMLRQRVDRGGKIYPLSEPHNLPALEMHPDEVGVVKQGPVRKWLEARKIWDSKYAHVSRKVQKERIRALANGEIKAFEDGERPPACALASRRTDRDLVVKKKRKSNLLFMWSMWGSKHDEMTLKREQEAEEGRPSQVEKVDQEIPTTSPQGADGRVDEVPAGGEAVPPTARARSSTRQRSLSSKRRGSESRVRGRARTVSVADRGQADSQHLLPALAVSRSMAPSTTTASENPTIVTTSPGAHDGRASPDSALLSAGFIPRFRAASHLRGDSASIKTGQSIGVASDDASTRALFAEAGVASEIENESTTHDSSSAGPKARRGSPLAGELGRRTSDDNDDDDDVLINGKVPHGGSDTPRSHRSIERLQSHQQDEGMGRLQPLRSPSSTAVVRAAGVVDIVPDGEADEGAAAEKKKDNMVSGTEEKEEDMVNGTDINGTIDPVTDARPKLYDRADTAFKTAMENPA
ncbi:uncharacterized protein PV06_06958 [Exophiala oligosperma]|uniref:Alpha/beta hydrolase fold-3 domain-containing protein n=1 Tax=Exophiala oligosperma TaxID=215243 RepID=A0A0D2AN47_9EURO|nr:uncharacterized protein PV06_06958 [Exophiala oligosperma]KIW41396.1 hypothetical protein PV06_06958 [Exophiala oligosperma]